MPLRRALAAATCLAAAGLAAPLAAQAQPQQEAVTAAPEAREHLALTLYNQGPALVADRRAVGLPAGESRLVFEDLPQEARPDSAVLRADGASVLVQALDVQPPTEDVLLRASVGQEVTVAIPTQGGEPVLKRARVLAPPPVALFEIDGQVTTSLPGALRFDGLPAGIRARPAWTGTVAAQAPVTAATLAYMTAGLDWRADYTLGLSPDGGTLSLEALATLTNDTATTFPADTVKLVAGDVARAPDSVQKAGNAPMMMEMARAASAPMAADAPREQLGAFHLYTLPRPVTLPAGSVVQAALLSAAAVPVETTYRLDGAQQVFFSQDRDSAPVHVETRLTFENVAKDGLGKPLPAGVVRVFRPDASGAPQLVGADRIDHTGEGRPVTITLGRAFDVTAERTQTDFERLSDRVTETAHRIVLRNARPEPVTVRVVESLPGAWEIVEASQPHEALSASRAAWDVEVPASSEAILTYRARVQF